MRKTLNRLIITSGFFLGIALANAQTPVLKNYDFDKGGYYLIGIQSESDFNLLASTLGEFYTNDIQLLNAIKKEWVFKKPSPKYACGYHYQVSICKGGVELESFYINLNCEEIVTDKGYFYFNPEKLRLFKSRFMKPFRQRETFTSLKAARNYREKILSQPNLIFTPNQAWVHYEGEFRFRYQCPERIKDCANEPEKKLAQLKEEIKKAYPKEAFALEYLGNSTDSIYVAVKSNQSLAKQFSLYKTEQWEPYRFNFYSYWTVKP